eukprot:Gb_26751 [translate_table: standard]
MLSTYLLFLFYDPFTSRMNIIWGNADWPSPLVGNRGVWGRCNSSAAECKAEEDVTMMMRRELGQHKLYITYASLSADRVPCQPGSGHPYYTPNCYIASGPVNPYTRGCKKITRCARSLE